MNGAGLKSDAVKTNGVIVDSSPPLSSCSIQYGFNTLINADFEKDLSFGWTHNDPNLETDLAGGRYVSLEKDRFIEQTVVTSPQGKYRVTVAMRSGERSGQQSHLDVDMAGHHRQVGASVVQW